jgi:3-methyladenine DNA glycosylase AlkD
MSLNKTVLDSLYAAQDVDYGDFSAKLIPNISRDCFIGVRTPQLREIAKDMVKSGQYKDFISCLPHKYFEENQLHAFIISQMRDFNMAIKEIERFLPYVNNWATCDQMSPRVFKKNLVLLEKHVCKWIKSKDVYSVRFAIKTMMQYWLDNEFDTKYADMVANVKSDEYYINMMRAWYFATAAAKQFDAILPYFRHGKLDEWTRLRAIQKSCESFRVSDKNKEILRTLR